MNKIALEQLKNIADYYGKREQCIKLCEELSELQIEAHHIIDGREVSVANLEEEIADTLVMIKQIIVLMKLDIGHINTIQEYKVGREVSRIENKYAKEVTKKPEVNHKPIYLAGVGFLPPRNRGIEK